MTSSASDHDANLPPLTDDFKDDLVAIGLRNRRGHDLRRTFITLAQVDGARRDLLKVITHGAAADDIINLYTTFPWPALCAEVAKLAVALPAGPADAKVTAPHETAPTTPTTPTAVATPSAPSAPSVQTIVVIDEMSRANPPVAKRL